MRVASQATTSAAFSAAPASATPRPGRWRAIAAQATWATAATANSTTITRSPVCAPAAAAWINPAPADARAATHSTPADAGGRGTVPSDMAAASPRRVMCR